MINRRLLSLVSLLFLFVELLDPTSPFVRDQTQSSQHSSSSYSTSSVLLAIPVATQESQIKDELFYRATDLAFWSNIDLLSFQNVETNLPELSEPIVLFRFYLPQKIYPDEHLVALL